MAMSHNIHWYIKHHICEHHHPGPIIFATSRQTLFLNHCVYGVYSTQFAATAAPPMSKCSDNRIRECTLCDENGILLEYFEKAANEIMPS